MLLAPPYYSPERIRFKSDPNIYKATVWRYGVYCEIIFNINNMPTNLEEVDTSKFELLTTTGKVYGTFEGYSTIYKLIENGFILSNDGSVYVEPEEPEKHEENEI